MSHAQPRVIALGPLGQPQLELAVAAAESGAIGVLARAGSTAGRLASRRLARWGRAAEGRAQRIGLWLSAPSEAPRNEAGIGWWVAASAAVASALPAERTARLLVAVTSVAEARRAVAAGANGLIARGHEAGGRIGSESSFVLLQRLVAVWPELPIWVQGGVGLHTAAAVVAGGGAGVVLDDALALTAESRLPEPVKRALAAFDGTQTRVVAGHRVLHRPDLGLAGWSTDDEDEVRQRLGLDLTRQLLPVGQGAEVAARLGARFGTTARLVSGLRESIEQHLAQAAEQTPLEADSPLARAFGTRYPIAQGPMTRVSDRAQFAQAVGEAGGLPFLALSLLRGPRVRALIEETRSLMGDRPFGVGILGFVPPELRREQLAVIEELTPPVVLIAGGRPSQARPLEERGMATWLHVPAPGLLELFLADGARRFIFEGRECGGHVGPLASFALWEAQIERLLAHEAVHEVSVLFAGGIHDARSAAMVSAMAAPLVARGARVGVLMGTAYLFTEEAVSAGAIQPGFQQAALDCAETVLLETAPGHATRCVESPYVQAFRARRAELTAEGLGAKEVWAALEELNLGRLRIASKGIRREGAELVSVDEADQAREGMFMIGQVAALRGEVVSCAALHAELAEGATARLAPWRPTVQLDESRAAPVDIAIIGMAGLFPGAPDIETYWSNVVAGVNAIREVPAERWNADIFYDPEGVPGEKTPSRWGGFLDPIAFDPLSYGIPPRSLAAIEPVQLLALEVARRALSDAGLAAQDSFDRERCAVIFGAEAGTELAAGYGFRAMWPQLVGDIPPELDEVLPRLSEDSFAGVLANVISGRIANRLDLGGANYTVDAACASSLTAVDSAVKLLITGEADLALAGGADLHNSINDYLMFASVHALSPRGQCRTFDATADGITLGEGVAAVVLKRLADARRDGDRIYAVIKAVGAASDGRSLGLTAPRQEGQVRAVLRAWERSGRSPGDAGLIEAHGTGTVVGDRTELRALTEVVQGAGATPGQTTLGSVKSQIGHTKCAAGLAGLIKVARALHHRILPPTLHVERPNPFFDRTTSPFRFRDQSAPWPAPADGRPRVAGVSAFGFGGTDFHAVVEENPGALAPAEGRQHWPCELILLRGVGGSVPGTASALLQRLEAAQGAVRLRDLAFTLACGGAPVQAAFLVSSRDELVARLRTLAAGERPAEVTFTDPEEDWADAPLALLFPGQGSQRLGMGRALFLAFPWLLEGAAAAGAPLDSIFPGLAVETEQRGEQQAQLTDTRVAQPALGVVEWACYELLTRLGIEPTLLAGHSYGELVALAAAGVLPEDALIQVSRARGEAMAAVTGADTGAMAAVKATAEQILQVVGEDVVLANHNAPRQVVISGATPAVEAAVERLGAHGLRARMLPVGCAFHSPLVAPAADRLAETLVHLPFGRARIPVYANTTAAPYPDEPAEARALLARQLARPVRFLDQIEGMYDAGARVFVECGPGRVLSSLTGRVLGDRPHLAVSIENGGPSGGLRQLLGAIARLLVAGRELDLSVLFEGRGAKLLDLNKPLGEAIRPTCWWVDGYRARPVKGALPEHAMLPTTGPVVTSLGQAPVAQGPQEQAVHQYLVNMQELVRAQREVMVRYLGAAPAPMQPIEAPVAASVPARSEAPRDEVIVAEVVEPEELDLKGTLLAIVSERTGYPVEMLDLDLDVEADLSIDSIKRIEILGALSGRLGLEDDGQTDRDAWIEELAAIRTLRGVIDFLEAEPAQELPAGEPTRALPAPAGPSASAPTAPASEAAAPAPLTRYVLSLESASLGALEPPAAPLAIVPDEAGLAAQLAELLRASGLACRILSADEERADDEGLIDLAGLVPGAEILAHYRRARAALIGGAPLLLVAQAGDGQLGRRGAEMPSPLGLGGLLRSASHEYPGCRVRAVELNLEEPAERLAQQLLSEVRHGSEAVEVGWHAGQRSAVVVREEALPSAGELSLDADSVVLVTGGARGVTARVAIELASRCGCQLELVGRSPLPGPEASDLAGAEDGPALRQRLLARGLTDPRAIEAEVARIGRAREVRSTLAALEGLGVRVAYHALDVRDEEAFGGLIRGLYRERGRLDAVLHGAGVIEDQLIERKEPDSFGRVYDTKIVAARVLARELAPTVRYLVFFGSVAGVFGNRGQVDYAAANDALDRTAHALDRRLPGRVLSVDWGPWAGGMVRPELARLYARRGIGLIGLEAGARALLDELARGDTSQSLWMCATPQAMRGEDAGS